MTKPKKRRKVTIVKVFPPERFGIWCNRKYKQYWVTNRFYDTEEAAKETLKKDKGNKRPVYCRKCQVRSLIFPKPILCRDKDIIWFGDITLSVLFRKVWNEEKLRGSL